MYGLEIKDLNVDFGTFKLSVNLNIRRGCITGLVGRNGAGKSTLIKCIMRQLSPSGGKILYNGKGFEFNEAEILNDIACVFDRPHFSLNAKPKALKKTFAGLYPNFDGELYDALMEKFSLPSDKKLNTFSYGMQRKYSLILAVCQRPKILVLDEPTSGIDPFDRGNVVDLIQEFMLDESHTVLFSTHITEDLDKIADYIVMMQDGKITLNDEKEEICRRYRLVQCTEMTEELRRCAIGLKTGMFGYTFLTENVNLSGEDLKIKVPTIEELFVHLLGEENEDVFGELGR